MWNDNPITFETTTTVSSKNPKLSSQLDIHRSHAFSLEMYPPDDFDPNRAHLLPALFVLYDDKLGISGALSVFL